jgi:queuine tRNA-ribosyltransferase
LLPQNKARYLMGLGKPEEIVSAVNAGIDMFDCVIPTREARHGRIYKFKKGGRNLEDKIFYENLQIDQNKFKEDFGPIDENCDCRTCREFSKAYLNHLFRVGEPLSLTLATIHNLKFYLEMMEKLRG